MARVFGILAGVILAVSGTIGFVQADHYHHNGHSMLGNKLNQNGTHVLHQANTHTAHALVKDGKVHNVSVTHKTKGAQQVKKYKTSVKRHALQNGQGATHYVMADPTEQEVALTLYVGFGFFDPISGHLFIYWFPVDIVFGGDQGCIDYGSN